MPRSAPVFYVDESVYSRTLISALTATGLTIERAGDAIPFGAPDEVWLEMAGKNGWTALMRDKRVRYRTLEREALVEFEVGAFVFSGGQATAQATADRIVALSSKMLAIATSEPRPFLYTFGLHNPLAKVKLKGL